MARIQPHTLFKALGSPDRLELLDLFSKNGQMSAKGMADITGGTVGNVAYHVKMLREAGLLKATKTRRVRGATETFMVLSARGEQALGLVAEGREGGVVIVVSLCDLTGTFVRPWADAGFDCYCVDIQHSIRRDRIEGNIRYVWGDVRSWAPPAPVAFLAAFPPCTDVAVSGAQDWATKGLPMLMDALELFNACHLAARWSRAPYMVENPVGALSTHVRPADFSFDPFEFGGYLDPPGDAYTKRTHLWTGGGFLMPVKRPVEPTEGSLMHFLPPGPERANLRSATPAGFARAVFDANHARVLEVAA